ncbi:MAG: 4'-phosphopantetheinyl transferase family protein [Bacteroidales bacterium]
MEIITKNEQFIVVADKLKNLTFYQSNLPESIYLQAKTLFKSNQRMCEWLHTHYLIYSLTGIFQSYSYNEKCKPYCNETKNQISITHTEHYIAIMLMYNGKGGVDMEETNRKFTKAAQKFLHHNEKKWAHDNHHFCKIWCFKEAAYKLIDDASADFKTHYICRYDNNMASVEYLPTSKNIKMNFVENENYFLTWCFEKD